MVLAIVVSVIAISLTRTVGDSLYEAFAKFNNRNYPSDSVWVISKENSGKGDAGNKLKISDVEKLVDSLGIFRVWDPLIIGGIKETKNSASSFPVNIFGVSERAEIVRNRSVIEGGFFDSLDVKESKSVALIGTTTAKNLFGDESPIGKQIQVDGNPLTVVGVLMQVGINAHGADDDDVVYLPYTTLMNKILHINYISAVTFRLNKDVELEKAATNVEGVLKNLHVIGEDQAADFSVITPIFIQKQLRKAFKVLNIFTTVLSIITFLVAGFVILLVMNTLMRQRVVEFGLKKAMGATDKFIYMEIAIELTLLCLISALIGLLLSSLLSIFLAPLANEKFGMQNLHISVSTMSVVIFASLVTGIAGSLISVKKLLKANLIDSLKS